MKKDWRPGTIFLSCFLLFACMTENNLQAQSSNRNWGIRTGLNALSITSYEACQADEILTNSSYTNKSGFLVTAFARFNINRLFLQPELGWNTYRRTCSFSLPYENGTGFYSPVNLKINSKVINTNFLIGYNIVRDYPFLLGAFVGSSFTGTHQIKYSLEPNQSFTQNGFVLNYTGLGGFSINISRIYFDLRYEISWPNADLNLIDIPDFPENYHNVKIKKTEAILSFSCGVMF